MGAEEATEKAGQQQRRRGIMAVEPKPRMGLVSRALDLIENAIVYCMCDSSKPLQFISGRLASVLDETPPLSDLHVPGSLPDCLNGEFIRVGPNPKFAPIVGCHWKQQYVYCTILDNLTKIAGIIKFDLDAKPEASKKPLEDGGNIKGIFKLGPGRFGSEAVYVPRQPGITSEEEDGYLIFFVTDENTGKSEVNVIGAKTMSSDPVAVVELPNRIPPGFHTFFVTDVRRK